MQNRTIVINGLSAKVGGGKTYLKNILSHLPDGNFKIIVVAPEGVTWKSDPRIERYSSPFAEAHPIARFLWEVLGLPLVMRKQGAGLLFCPGGIHFTRKSRNFKIVTMFRNMHPFDNKVIQMESFGSKLKLRFKKWLMLNAMRSADQVIFISDYARDVIQSLIPIKSAITIPHGISVEFIHGPQTLERPALPFPEKYILYVSRFEIYKRHLELVEAYSLLPEDLRKENKLLLIGETDLPPAKIVRRAIAEKGLDDQIVVYGAVPYGQLPAYYQNTSLFVFASVCENCPNILLEAIASRVPIVCSNVAPMPEFGGDLVSYMNPDFPKDIASKMEQALRLPRGVPEVEFNRKIEASSWGRTAEKTWGLLKSL